MRLMQGVPLSILGQSVVTSLSCRDSCGAGTERVGDGGGGTRAAGW